MARTNDRIELPKPHQLEALARASIEARTILENASRVLHTVDLSKLTPHERALVLTVREDTDSFFARYYNIEAAV